MDGAFDTNSVRTWSMFDQIGLPLLMTVPWLQNWPKGSADSALETDGRTRKKKKGRRLNREVMVQSCVSISIGNCDFSNLFYQVKVVGVDCACVVALRQRAYLTPIVESHHVDFEN